MQERWLVSMFGSLAIAVGVGQFPPARPNATAAAIAAASLSAHQTPRIHCQPSVIRSVISPPLARSMTPADCRGILERLAASRRRTA